MHTFLKKCLLSFDGDIPVLVQYYFRLGRYILVQDFVGHSLSIPAQISWHCSQYGKTYLKFDTIFWGLRSSNFIILCWVSSRKFKKIKKELVGDSAYENVALVILIKKNIYNTKEYCAH
jgi:hypothetical protein